MCAHWYIKGIQKKKKFERNLKKCPDIASSPSSAIELDVIYLFVVVVVSIVLDKISEFWVQTFLWYNTEIIDFFLRFLYLLQILLFLEYENNNNKRIELNCIAFYLAMDRFLILLAHNKNNYNKKHFLFVFFSIRNNGVGWLRMIGIHTKNQYESRFYLCGFSIM